MDWVNTLLLLFILACVIDLRHTVSKVEARFIPDSRDIYNDPDIG